MSYFEWNIIHIFKLKPGTVEKNSSAIGPPAGNFELNDPSKTCIKRIKITVI